jgi:Gpi18-like mannosyltransferase
VVSAIHRNYSKKATKLFGIIKKQLVGHDFLIAVCLSMSVIVLGVALPLENNKIVLTNPDPHAHYSYSHPQHLGFLSNWDGPNYIAIAEHGYVHTDQANFFPLYPLAIATVRIVVRSYLDSALLVAWLSMLGAVYFYIKITRRIFASIDTTEAIKATLLFVFYPTGVFLFATYTEGLFAFLALGSIYFALKQRYILAGLFCMLAAATHINGLFVALFILLLLYEQRLKLHKLIITAVLSGLGLIGYMVYLQIHFSNALAFISAQRQHGWLAYGVHGAIADVVTLNGIFLRAVMLSVVYWWKRRASFAIYSLLYVGIALLGVLGGFGRYSLMAFPVQFMLYDYLKNKKLGYSIGLILTVIFWTFYVLQYGGGYVGG